MPSKVSVLEGAQNVRMEGGTINAVSGDMTINNSSRRTTNYDSFNAMNRSYNNAQNNHSVNDYSTRNTRNVYADTVNNFGYTQNVNTGENRGTINQQDSSGGPGISSWLMYAQMQREYDYQRGGGQDGQGSRPPMPFSHSGPPTGPPYQQQPHNYGYPYQPSAAYPPRGFPHGHPQYQSSAQYAAPREGYDDMREDDEDEGLNTRGPVPFSAASHPGARSGLTASAPPSIASSNASAQGVTPSAWGSNNPFGASVPRDYH